jgi:DNA invertase Pin-like site-specific DNA recombinase
MSADVSQKRRTAAIYHALESAEETASSDLLRLRQCSHDKGWQLAGEYIDYRGGSGIDSFEYDRLIGDAHRRRFDVLLFHSLEVLCRGGCRDAVADLSLLLRLGVAVKSLEQPELDTTGEHGQIVASLVNLLARQERQHLSRRIRKGMSQARRGGKKVGRPHLPDELQREIARQRRAGKSLAAIAHDLEVAPSTALKYSRPAIDVLLRRK